MAKKITSVPWVMKMWSKWTPQTLLIEVLKSYDYFGKHLAISFSLQHILTM